MTAPRRVEKGSPEVPPSAQSVFQQLRTLWRNQQRLEYRSHKIEEDYQSMGCMPASFSHEPINDLLSLFKNYNNADWQSVRELLSGKGREEIKSIFRENHETMKTEEIRNAIGKQMGRLLSGTMNVLTQDEQAEQDTLHHCVFLNSIFLLAIENEEYKRIILDFLTLSKSEQTAFIADLQSREQEITNQEVLPPQWSSQNIVRLMYILGNKMKRTIFEKNKQKS